MTTPFVGWVLAASAVGLPAVGLPVPGFVAISVADLPTGVLAAALECPDVTVATTVEAGVFAVSAVFVGVVGFAATLVPVAAGAACKGAVGVPVFGRAAIACGCIPAVVDAPDFTWRNVHVGFAFVNSAMAEGGVEGTACAPVFAAGVVVFAAGVVVFAAGMVAVATVVGFVHAGVALGADAVVMG
jgi:hypothetical protein